MDCIHYTSSVFEYHVTVWRGLLKDRLHFVVSRKRSLARKISNVKSWGWLHRGLEAWIRKNASVYREESSDFCPGFGCHSSQLRDGWGACQALPTGQFGRQSEFSPLLPLSFPLTTILECDFLDFIINQWAFYFLYVFWKYVGLSPSLSPPITLTAMSVLPFLNFILVRCLEGENHGHMSILFLSWL